MLYLLNEDEEPIEVIDSYISLVWVECYVSPGEFEVELPLTLSNIMKYKPERHIMSDESEFEMIIERIEVTTNEAENTRTLVVSGRGMASVLDRRIVWTQTVLSNYPLGESLYTLYTNNTKVYTEPNISPSMDRTLPGYRFPHYYWGNVAKENRQYTGDNLLTVFEDSCTACNFGFKCVRDPDDNLKKFKLYQGVDRSVDQNECDPVVLSSEYDTLLSTSYYLDKSEYKNSALMLGEGEGTARLRDTFNNEASGLDRRELFVDARDLSRNKDDPDETKRISTVEYLTMLQTRAMEKLAEVPVTEALEGTAIPGSLVYGVDYYLGDIVTVSTDYGITKNVRITEMSITEDENGRVYTPTFADVSLSTE